EDGEWDAVLRARVRVEDHWDKHDDVAEQDGEDGLLPVHAAGDQAGGEHVGRYADRHGDPEGGEVGGSPGALFGRDGGEVFVVERGVVVPGFVLRCGAHFHAPPRAVRLM